MPKILVGKINIYYEIHGSGFPLVMIMGLGGSSAAWDRYIVEEFSKKFRVIIFDNRGAGLTDCPKENYTIDMLAEDTAGLLKALNVPRAHVLGVSMGGMIAIKLTLKYPEMVEKLILGCTTGGGSRFIPPKTDAIQTLSGLMSKDPKEALNAGLHILYTKEFLSEHPERIEEFIEQMKNSVFSVEGIMRQLAGISVYDAHDQLHTIKKPTLILAGKKDNLVPFENSQILSEKIPNSKLILFEDATHGFYSQKREEFCQIVLEFLKDP
ncbi:MAG: alpha/beta hydrolase [Candidatus Jordarchaeaceae archaeon]